MIDVCQPILNCKSPPCNNDDLTSSHDEITYSMQPDCAFRKKLGHLNQGVAEATCMDHMLFLTGCKPHTLLYSWLSSKHAILDLLCGVLCLFTLNLRPGQLSKLIFFWFRLGDPHVIETVELMKDLRRRRRPVRHRFWGEWRGRGVWDMINK